VLIHAVGSGVGSMGIQDRQNDGGAGYHNCNWKLEKAKELGANEVINYRETSNISQRMKELTDGKRVDLAFDCIGADVWEENLLYLKPGGRLVITSVTSGARRYGPFHPAKPPLHLMGSGDRCRHTFGGIRNLAEISQFKPISPSM
jgi:NADPH:quinone reductase-like Zn-dependent oxidoreductase